MDKQRYAHSVLGPTLSQLLSARTRLEVCHVSKRERARPHTHTHNDETNWIQHKVMRALTPQETGVIEFGSLLHCLFIYHKISVRTHHLRVITQLRRQGSREFEGACSQEGDVG